nr:restriction endonuclease subunit S [Priestia megaterium]
MSRKKKTIEELLERALVSKEEQLYKVPENWLWIRVENAIKPMETRDPKKLDAKVFHYIDVDAIDNKKQSIGQVKEVEITLAPSRAKRKVSKNDVIISLVRPYLKNIAHIEIDDKKLMASTAFYVCTPKEILNSNYLYSYLCSNYATQYLNDHTRGDNSPSVRSTDYEKMPIPVPPVNEQKRIAEKVERLLSKVEEAKRLIEEAKETFELRRAAILDKAFRGELTRKWREENPSIESALERVELIKQERFYIAETKREISEITEMFDELNTEECIDNNDWLYLKANMFCYNINCGGTPSKDISKEGEIPFLKVYNIVNNKVSFSYKPQYIPKEIHKTKLKKSILKANDVIMNIVGPPLKKIAIIPEEYYEMNMNQAIVRFRPMKYVLPKYLYYCLQYDETLRDVINETRGVVGQSNISVSQSRNLIMPIPSLEEQAEIVSKLEEMIKREEIALSLVSDEKNLDELKQSILSKAFRGELGTNDPGEESAIELLKEVLQKQVK